MAWIEHRGDTWRVRYYRTDGSIATESGHTHPDTARQRAHDIEYESRQGTFKDPQRGQMLFGDWCETWCEAHDVSANTWAKYHAHLRNHIRPKFEDTPLSGITRMSIRSWTKKLRRDLSDTTVTDIVTLLSMILSEAVEEELIGSNPCRRLKVTLNPAEPREIATHWQLHRIAQRCPHHQLLIWTAAYTGLRWSELAALQWRNVHLTHRTLTVDPKHGALHETHGQLELGAPKTPASARTVHLPTFLTELLRQHPTRTQHEHVFLSEHGRLLRRANFRDRVWRPAVAGHAQHGWAPLLPKLTFHALRHTHKTWLIEDAVPEVLQHQRLGHRMPGIRGIYSHPTQPMIDAMLTALEHRWQRDHTATISA